ncbi:hypothetical protein P3T43_001778 [Paraburkholderia sp. GAS41]|uniref:VapE domain-containing protein n=1 Tax=Paraburkholderia sp. GAS41 TaxID=3035134 RepID=UPI003D261A58
MAKKIAPPTEAEVNSEEFQLEMQGFSAAALEKADAIRASSVETFKEKALIAANAAQIPDIVERAKELEDVIQFSDVRKVRMGDQYVAVPEPTDTNKRVVLDYLFKGAEAKPHFDKFRGRIVDHAGVIVDDFYSGTAFLNAYNAVGLRKLKLKEVIEAVRAYALDHRQNDLSERIDGIVSNIEWDGKERLSTALIEMFGSHDTEQNRIFGLYFWTSLYCRMMFPGELAPIVLVLCGAMDCGKSYFGKLLARMLTGDDQADSIQFNLDSNRIDFLRDITGQSVVCNLGELAGANRAELNRTKDFITRTHDSFSFKFEGSLLTPRQWICIGDINKYEAVYRDPSGNRRLFVMHCGQGDDIEGQPQQIQGFKANFDELKNGGLWQLMAEARHWLENNGGLDGYRDMVRSASKMVFEHSQNEVQNDRGTIRDDSVAPHIIAALSNAPCREIKARDGSGKTFVFYDRSDLITAIQAAATPLDPTKERRFLMDLAKACGMKGGGIPAKRESGRVPGFAFYDHQTKAALLTAIGADGEADEARVISGTVRKVEGF